MFLFVDIIVLFPYSDGFQSQIVAMVLPPPQKGIVHLNYLRSCIYKCLVSTACCFRQ